MRSFYYICNISHIDLLDPYSRNQCTGQDARRLWGRWTPPSQDVSTSPIPNHIFDAAVASHFQLPWSLTSDSRASSRFGKCILHLTACRTTTIPRPKSRGGRSPRDPWIVWCPRKFRRRLLWPLKWPKKPRHWLVNWVVYLFFLLLMTLKIHLYHYIHNITQFYNYIYNCTVYNDTHWNWFKINFNWRIFLWKAPSARKEPEVECISSSCSSTSESDDVPNPLSAAERAKLKVGLCCGLGDPNSQGFVWNVCYITLFLPVVCPWVYVSASWLISSYILHPHSFWPHKSYKSQEYIPIYPL